MTDKRYTLSESIDTTGGPLIVMSTSLLGSWYGCFEAPTPREAVFRFNHPNDPATDYDRACDVESLLGVISVGEGNALVLGDMPVATYLATVESEHLILVKPVLWDDDDIEQAIAYSFVGDFEERIDSYAPHSSAHMLFDSSCSAEMFSEDDSSTSINFELPASSYSIETFVYQPNKRVYVVTHRFIPTAPSAR